ncbi:MAG: ester cyclase [Acetobacteraceae bacterium]
MPGHADTFMHRWFEEVWNRGREDAIDEMMGEDTVIHGLQEDIRGPEAFKPFHRQFRTAFPDMRISVEEVLIDGNMLAARCSVAGTHTGPGLPVQAAGKPASFTGMCMARVKDGKMIEGWYKLDFLSLYQQIGLQLH